MQSGKESVSRRKGCDPACPGKTGQRKSGRTDCGSRINFSFRTSVSNIPVVTELAPNVRYDVIFVVLRYTQLDSALGNLAGESDEKYCFCGNNVQARALAAALPEKNILFAFALSAGHREPNRVVSIDLKKITIGAAAWGGLQCGTDRRDFSAVPNTRSSMSRIWRTILLCHAAFVMPAAFACYKTDGDLKKLRKKYGVPWTGDRCQH